MYRDLFQRVTAASQNNSLTFFVGAGISKLSNAPKWSELIDAFSDNLGIAKRGAYSNEEFLSIPQMYYYSINQDDTEYYSFIDHCFAKAELVPNAIHKLLFALNPHAFVTTNFDDLLEKAAVECCQSFKVVACDKEISQINGDRFILKLHGDLTHKNIVLKEEDYLNYSDNFKLTETLLRSIFATNTVVFIGYGLNDYNIKLILNWTKTLLKDKFVKPLFIYTDDKELSKEELRYHESKGLHVIDFRKLTSTQPELVDYFHRYELVLSSISKTSKLSLDGLTKEEAFDVLYDLLVPLDKLQALRIQDVKETLGFKVIIEDRGVINTSVGENILLKYFVEILSMSDLEKNDLPTDVLSKYHKISRVFQKARIYYVFGDSHKALEIEGESSVFADPLCINFEYRSMIEYTKAEYTNNYDNYKKAYYLAKLCKYADAYNLFVDVAVTSFKEKDYLLTFLAQANRNYLYSSMRSVNNHILYHNMFDLDSVNGGKLNDVQMKHLFEHLPLDTQQKYLCFKDLASTNSLYEISYDSFIDGKKLQNAIESNTLEMGFSSGEKVFHRINNYLHFFLGNSLFMDEFAEFKNTIRNLMSLLLYKYSVQEKKVFDKDWLEGLSENKILFDELDFYCFLTYFNENELRKMFSKYGVKTIEINNIDVIAKSVLNIFDYYDILMQTKASTIEALSCQQKIKVCIALLCYMDIPQDLVDSVCQFIFKYEFREIDISDKVAFLDAQIWKRKKYSEITSTVIENKLMFYLDKHIKSIETGKKFELYSHSSAVSYCNLAHYIHIGESFTSKRLSIRVSKIVRNDYTQFKKAIERHYYSYISTNQKHNFTSWVKRDLPQSTDFDDFCFLISNQIRLEKKDILAIKKHLQKMVANEETNEEKIKYRTFPSHEPYEDLQDIGYYCFIGYLPKRQFKGFLGYSPKFDFFYKYRSFDFDKFEVAWLLHWQSHVLDELAKSCIVKEKIRNLIAKELSTAELNDLERKKLEGILVKHFC